MEPYLYRCQSSFWYCLFGGNRFKVTLGKDQLEIYRITLFQKPQRFAIISLNEILNIRINEQQRKQAEISIRLTNNKPLVTFQLPPAEAMKLKNFVAMLS